MCWHAGCNCSMLACACVASATLPAWLLWWCFLLRCAALLAVALPAALAAVLLSLTLLWLHCISSLRRLLLLAH